MSKKSNLKTYSINAKLDLMVSIDVTADSLESALAMSKEFRECDFVEFKGDFMDGGIRITGVWEQ